MSFGGLFDGGSGGARIVADIPYQSPLVDASLLTRSTFASPGLSLGLTNMEGKGQMSPLPLVGGGGVGGGDGGGEIVSVRKEEENDSRSGSDNVDGGSGDDLERGNPRKKKRYHRHTPQQIQELENLFKECPHPDEKQRLELSRRLNLEGRQVKFWFQNRRTQMKTQLERHENSILRQENDKLRQENLSIREVMRNPICNNCGGPAMLGDVSLEEQHLRIENARLKDELERVCSLTGKFLGRPISSLTNSMTGITPSPLDLAVGHNGGFAGFGAGLPPTLSEVPDFGPRASDPLGSVGPPVRAAMNPLGRMDQSPDTAMLVDLAFAAMDELMKMAQLETPLWVPTCDGRKEELNYDEYARMFPRCIGPKPVGYISEATREDGMVIVTSEALVKTLMDANRWADMFPCMISRSCSTEIIANGIGQSRNGMLQLMSAEFQFLSPLVPIRKVNFLRFCKQHANGIWAVVDVSIDGTPEIPPAMGGTTYMGCRRLPSGCLAQDMPNGYCKVTWVEHSEYDESTVHHLYRPLLRSGMGLGAKRWIATMQRQCECFAILMSSELGTRDHDTTLTARGRQSMLKLAQRMTENFCAGVCVSSMYKWTPMRPSGSIREDVRVLTRQSLDDPGEPPGVVLSAATSVWLPVSPGSLFQFLRDEHLRSEWDILSNGVPMKEMLNIAKGKDSANAVSLLRANVSADVRTVPNQRENNMLILQETCSDASGSLVVYAPVDIPAMHLVMNGGDSSYVALLPSGFSIIPDCGVTSGPGSPRERGGSLLTVAFQILVNNLPTAKLTVESVETVNNLLTCTIQKIRAAVKDNNS